MSDPNNDALLALAIGVGTGSAEEAVDTVTRAIHARSRQEAKADKIFLCRVMERDPNCEVLREALKIWGFNTDTAEVTYMGGLMGLKNTVGLRVDRPDGWSMECHGPVHKLIGPMGHTRLSWYQHGWDPNSSQLYRAVTSQVIDLAADKLLATVTKKIMGGHQEVLYSEKLDLAVPRDLQIGSAWYYENASPSDSYYHEKGDLEERAKQFILDNFKFPHDDNYFLRAAKSWVE